MSATTFQPEPEPENEPSATMLSVGAVPASVPPKFWLLTLKSPATANGLASVNVISVTLVLATPSVPPTVATGVVSVTAASVMLKLVPVVLTSLPPASCTVSATLYVPAVRYVSVSATTFQPVPDPENEPSATMLNVGAVPARVPPKFWLLTLKSPATANGLASVNVITTTFVLAVPSVALTVATGVVSVSGASATLKLVPVVLTSLPPASCTVSATLYVPAVRYVSVSATTFQPVPDPENEPSATMLNVGAVPASVPP